MSKKQFLTTNEVAKELGVHQSRIYALIESERLPATRFGKSWLIEAKDIELVRERKVGRPKKESKEIENDKNV
jgi:excisionase family DNA binding protein